MDFNAFWAGFSVGMLTLILWHCVNISARLRQLESRFCKFDEEDEPSESAR